jgi:hypothetical protein
MRVMNGELRVLVQFYVFLHGAGPPKQKRENNPMQSGLAVDGGALSRSRDV